MGMDAARPWSWCCGCGGAFVLLTCVLACGGREAASNPAATARGGTGNLAGAADLGTGMTGRTATGGTGTNSEPGGSSAEAGAASTPQACDAACLDSVASMKSDFGIAWQSSWFLMGCKALPGHDCVNAAICPSVDAPRFDDRGISTLETFPIGGVPGQRYKVTFTFNAVMSAKDYVGGKRDQGDNVPSSVDVTPLDGFYRDGHAVGTSPTGALNGYDSWRLSVLDEMGVELRHYFMNSLPPGRGYESHRTFLLSYTKSIVVVGGGKVTHLVHGPNCRSIDNCGLYQLEPEGCAPRNIPNEPAATVLPATYLDAEDQQLKPTNVLSVFNPEATQPWRSNLGHLTVTAVEATDDPVTQDYL